MIPAQFDYLPPERSMRLCRFWANTPMRRRFWQEDTA